ncbi:MAG: hypothetical protein WCO04_16155 [Pseudomonadota bacterium]
MGPFDPLPDRILPLLVALFVGSGCAALIYEVVWFQLLQLTIGSSAVSLSVLLGTFMGGMCLGSLLLPRLVSPRRHPLAVYAWLEFGIAASGLLVLFGAPALGAAYDALAPSGYLGIVGRGVVAAACLLPPTMMMGATLPAVARWVKTTPGGLAWLGWFYGGNIIGAVAGCLLAGFVLLPRFDMTTATFVAIACNLAVGCVGLALAGSLRYEPAFDVTPAAAGPRGGGSPPVVVLRVARSPAAGARRHATPPGPGPRAFGCIQSRFALWTPHCGPPGRQRGRTRTCAFLAGPNPLLASTGRRGLRNGRGPARPSPKAGRSGLPATCMSIEAPLAANKVQLDFTNKPMSLVSPRLDELPRVAMVQMPKTVHPAGRTGAAAVG